MELVIDANILMSALVMSEGYTYDLIFNDSIKLFAPEFLLDEIEEHKAEILEKSGLSNEEFELFLSLISSRIEFIPYTEFESFVSEAEKIVFDIDDREYVALALKLNCKIWSNDRKLKQQSQVGVYSTSELIEFIF